ncbi:MAG: septum formation inhibitor Maf [Steroidobacteraceae bacterium]|nr:septum formation inhibitor Maf [Steroidobacteraceae bacterium]
MSYDSIILASASERRSRLLRQIGVRHEVMAMDLDESRHDGEPARDHVLRLACGKAGAAVKALGASADRPVLAADTVVVLDGTLYGKPADEDGCVAILAALAGRTHEVLTAVAVLHAGRLATALSESRVSFRAIDEAECRRYWATGEPAGKAGAYAIQGRGAVFVSRIEGSHSGVVGLPLFETAALLDAAGVRRWQPERPHGRAGPSGRQVP